MIPIQRDRTKIAAAFIDPARRNHLLELFREARDGRLKVREVKERLFASSRWSAAKTQLGRETFGKCAFCEAPTDASYYGDVEHIRPKADYWWLAYCYDNWLYSCRLCNGKKSDTHEFAGPALLPPGVTQDMDDNALMALASEVVPDPSQPAAVAQLLMTLRSEDGSLPDPYSIDPQTLFRWEVSETLREVRLAPRLGVNEAARAFEAAERIIGINRAELLIARWKTYQNLAKYHQLMQLAPVLHEEITAQMLVLAAPDAPFSAMTKYFAHEVWGLI